MSRWEPRPSGSSPLTVVWAMLTMVLAQVTPREVGDVRGLGNSGRHNLEGRRPLKNQAFRDEKDACASSVLVPSLDAVARLPAARAVEVDHPAFGLPRCFRKLLDHQALSLDADGQCIADDVDVLLPEQRHLM